MSKYIVWVGGVPDYEGTSKVLAEEIAAEWIVEGYKDVIIEEGN